MITGMPAAIALSIEGVSASASAAVTAIPATLRATSWSMVRASSAASHSAGPLSSTVTCGPIATAASRIPACAQLKNSLPLRNTTVA